MSGAPAPGAPRTGLLLGIETAAELVGVALADGDGPRAGVWLRGGRRHAETLAPAIAHVLAQAGATLSDVTTVAVDVGPGLFTGIRVGVATAQGLARGLGVPVVALTSVDVLARTAYDAGWDGPVVAVVDARRGEVFAARYEGPPDRPGAPARYAPAVLAAELAAELAASERMAERAGVPSPPPPLLVGNGARRYAGELAPFRVAALEDPSPRALVALAAGRLAAGDRGVPAAEVRPVYLREADARINWVQR